MAQLAVREPLLGGDGAEDENVRLRNEPGPWRLELFGASTPASRPPLSLGVVRRRLSRTTERREDSRTPRTDRTETMLQMMQQQLQQQQQSLGASSRVHVLWFALRHP